MLHAPTGASPSPPLRVGRFAEGRVRWCFPVHGITPRRVKFDGFSPCIGCGEGRGERPAGVALFADNL